MITIKMKYFSFYNTFLLIALRNIFINIINNSTACNVIFFQKEILIIRLKRFLYRT